MTFRLYKGLTGWLLVPDFLQPPPHVFDPLEFLGFVDEEQLRPVDLRGVQLAIRSRHYAPVSESLVRQLWPSRTPS